VKARDKGAGAPCDKKKKEKVSGEKREKREEREKLLGGRRVV
jgi:hypothetical protein